MDVFHPSIQEALSLERQGQKTDIELYRFAIFHVLEHEDYEGKGQFIIEFIEDINEKARTGEITYYQAQELLKLFNGHIPEKAS